MKPAVTHKSPQIARLIEDCHGTDFSAHYLGYFKCFDQGLFYEAHDVLEELWLGAREGDYFYYKGLIQAAGAFVHLQKQRLRPAVALFNLSNKNLKPFTPVYQKFEVEKFLQLNESYCKLIIESDYSQNALKILGNPIISNWLSRDKKL